MRASQAYLLVIIRAVCKKRDQLIACPLFSQSYGDGLEPPHAIESEVGVFIFEFISAEAGSSLRRCPCAFPIALSSAVMQ